jgi:hypothetical protein
MAASGALLLAREHWLTVTDGRERAAVERRPLLSDKENRSVSTFGRRRA